MTAPDSPAPTDLDTLRAALAAEGQARLEAEARASGAEAMIAHLKLMIAKLRHDRFGASSERGRKLLDQLEDDGRFCMTNNAAERSLRGVGIGRKAWLFACSDRGGERAAAMYSLIATAKMNDVDPRAWLADVLARIADNPARRLEGLLPWNWRQAHQTVEQTIAA